MKVLIVFYFFLYADILAQIPAGDDILSKIDRNLSSRNRILTTKMIIHGRRGSRTIESRSWVQTTEKSFTEYLAPAREKGTKMLKLSNQLWLYAPATDRIIQISGHMLRQSVMGSDLSYEDMMEDARLAERYHAHVTTSEQVDDRDCWVLELTARSDDMNYYACRLWVDKERWLPLKEELFAKSGKLLKKLEFKDIRLMSGRWFPMQMIFKDMLKTGAGTEFIIGSIQFDQEIPEYIFSKAALKK